MSASVHGRRVGVTVLRGWAQRCTSNNIDTRGGGGGEEVDLKREVRVFYGAARGGTAL